MIKIKIITVGKLKEKYLIDGINEYAKRMLSFSKLEFNEVIDEKIPDRASKAQEEIIKLKEGRRILDKIKENDYLILLDVQAKQLSSIDFSNYLDKLAVDGKSSIAFVIGGSLGISPEVKKRSNFEISFSKMTFPHQLMKLVLIEQIYRAFKIIHNQTYHK
jgi:rRNA large subunit m3Psi methyltransferase RlmH